MGKSVENGVLKSISPSSINKFDASAPFGCQRRWWYRYVQGLDEPQSGNQFLGESLHALIEARLTQQEVNMQTDPEANGLYLAGEAMIEEVAKRRILAVEASVLGYSLAGVKVQGYCDVVTSDGIIDWKTSSDIRRYGKTAEDLATDTQMVMYARAFHPDREWVKLAHGQFQTKGNKRTNFVEVAVEQIDLALHEGNVIIPLVEEMKKAAALDDVSKLPRNEKSCFNCAYRSHCPTQEGNTIMSFFMKLGATKSETPAPVLPPDAPKSDPALAAAPVEGFAAVPPPKERKMKMVDEPAPEPVRPVEPMQEAAEAILDGDLQKFDEAVERIEAQKKAETEKRNVIDKALDISDRKDEHVQNDVEARNEGVAAVKRGRGRPPGSKNKAKEVPAPAYTPVVFPPGSMAALSAEEQAACVPSVAIKSVTVSKGFTVNLGSFNSVRFDVSVTGEGSDLELVYSTLMGEIEERLNAEAAKYESEVDQKNKTMKPAQEVVCK